jgi:hypothetical protein
VSELPEPTLVPLGVHPRAAYAIRRAKSIGGIVGFLLVLAGGLAAGTPLASACARALAGGIGAYLVTWAAVLAAWRHLLRAEARRAVEALRRRAAEQA